MNLTIRKRAIGKKWVFRNKKDERGIMIRNKARGFGAGPVEIKRVVAGRRLVVSRWCGACGGGAVWYGGGAVVVCGSRQPGWCGAGGGGAGGAGAGGAGVGGAGPAWGPGYWWFAKLGICVSKAVIARKGITVKFECYSPRWTTKFVPRSKNKKHGLGIVGNVWMDWYHGYDVAIVCGGKKVRIPPGKVKSLVIEGMELIPD
ncbi:hypothetical protein Tco_0793385 [Tanacetum coccineum]